MVVVDVGGGVVREGGHSGVKLNAAGCADSMRGTRQMQRMRHWVYCCVLVRGGGDGVGGVMAGVNGTAVG